MSPCSACSDWQIEQDLGSFWTASDCFSRDDADCISSWASINPYGLLVHNESPAQVVTKRKTESIRVDKRQRPTRLKKMDQLGLLSPPQQKYEAFVAGGESAAQLREKLTEMQRKERELNEQEHVWNKPSPAVSVNALLRNLNNPPEVNQSEKSRWMMISSQPVNNSRRPIRRQQLEPLDPIGRDKKPSLQDTSSPSGLNAFEILTYEDDIYQTRRTSRTENRDRAVVSLANESPLTTPAGRVVVMKQFGLTRRRSDEPKRSVREGLPRNHTKYTKALEILYNVKFMR